jgi:hypothetical protein
MSFPALPYPPAWMIVVGAVALAASVIVRLRWSVGIGGALNIFLLPLTGWLGLVYALATLHLAGFEQPNVLGMAVRLVLLLFLLTLTLINIATAYDNRRVIHTLRRLGVSLDG